MRLLVNHNAGWELDDYSICLVHCSPRLMSYGSGMWVPRSLLSFRSSYLYALCVARQRTLLRYSLLQWKQILPERRAATLCDVASTHSMQGDRPPPTGVKLTPSPRQDALITQSRPAKKVGLFCYIYTGAHSSAPSERFHPGVGGKHYPGWGFRHVGIAHPPPPPNA